MNGGMTLYIVDVLVVVEGGRHRIGALARHRARQQIGGVFKPQLEGTAARRRRHDDAEAPARVAAIFHGRPACRTAPWMMRGVDSSFVRSEAADLGLRHP